MLPKASIEHIVAKQRKALYDMPAGHPREISGSLPYLSDRPLLIGGMPGKRSRDAPRPNAERRVPGSMVHRFRRSETGRIRRIGFRQARPPDPRLGQRHPAVEQSGLRGRLAAFPERKARAGHQGHRHRLAALPARRRARHAVEQDIRPLRHATGSNLSPTTSFSDSRTKKEVLRPSPTTWRAARCPKPFRQAGPGRCCGCTTGSSAAT